MTKQNDANLLLMDIMDSITKYFDRPLEKQLVKKKGKYQRKIKPAKNPTIYKDKFATCKYCGDEEFFWGETEWGWRLFDKDSEQHMCKDQTESKNGQPIAG